MLFWCYLVLSLSQKWHVFSSKIFQTNAVIKWKFSKNCFASACWQYLPKHNTKPWDNTPCFRTPGWKIAGMALPLSQPLHPYISYLVFWLWSSVVICFLSVWQLICLQLETCLDMSIFCCWSVFLSTPASTDTWNGTCPSTLFLLGCPCTSTWYCNCHTNDICFHSSLHFPSGLPCQIHVCSLSISDWSPIDFDFGFLIFCWSVSRIPPFHVSLVDPGPLRWKGLEWWGDSSGEGPQ